MSREMAEMLSLVCSVEKIRCPVWAAVSAISAVSGSRISPTITTSGSWRSTERRQPENVRPALEFTCTWLAPSSMYSIGSSIVVILMADEWMRLSAA